MGNETVRDFVCGALGRGASSSIASPTETACVFRSPDGARSGSRLEEGVRQANFDERLPGHTESTGLLIDFPQQVDREVHVDTLNGSARAEPFAKVYVGRQVDTCVVHCVEMGGRERFSSGGTLLFLHRVLAGRR